MRITYYQITSTNALKKAKIVSYVTIITHFNSMLLNMLKFKRCSRRVAHCSRRVASSLILHGYIYSHCADNIICKENCALNREVISRKLTKETNKHTLSLCL